jgi:hypothetical protein
VWESRGKSTGYCVSQHGGGQPGHEGRAVVVVDSRGKAFEVTGKGKLGDGVVLVVAS